MNAGAWRATLGFGALCLVTPFAGALSLGELEVRSPPGAPLEARIPVLGGADQSLRGACFTLSPRGAAPLREASLELRRSAHAMNLFVRTRGAVSDGATFAIAIDCPGAAAGSAPVEYAVRFGARRASAVERLPLVTTLSARDGDSLESLAHAIFPNDRSVRARYVEAMRAANASLAARGDAEPLAPGTQVALPDLRAFASTIPAPRASRPAEAAAARRAPLPAPHAAPVAVASAREPQAPRKSITPESAPLRRVPRLVKPPSSVSVRAAASADSGGGFLLRLSAPVLDLSPSKGMDERKRAELRERMLVMEADDRTAEMLALRENVRRLEAQVNQLKLKLAAMPSSLPARPLASEAAKPAQARVATAEAVPPKVEAPKTEAKAEPPKPAAPKAESSNTAAPNAEPSSAEATKPESSKTQAPKPDASNTEAPAAETAQAAKASPREHRKPNVVPRAPGEDSWYSNAVWWLRLLLIPLAGLLGLRYFARRRPGDAGKGGEVVEEVAQDVPTTEPGAQEILEEPTAEAPSEEIAPEVATRVPEEDNVELRRRYMQERFPEIVNGAVMLEDPRSVVNAARLLYEDGTVARAIELLQFEIEQDPDAMPAWLALFEIFRLQGLTGEFAELARRFSERHGASDEWRKVSALGRSLDPGNPLYEGVDSGMPVDPAREGWLRAPGDDARRALAGELRSRLMTAASVSDADLRPDPTPALRKAEIFSVA
ncbi:MAG TPA: hypothetical protein VLY46_04680 [Usitatibacter sp.]|nr:hypothetical protein [Usitatibacter sp.]